MSRLMGCNGDLRTRLTYVGPGHEGLRVAKPYGERKSPPGSTKWVHPLVRDGGLTYGKIGEGGGKIL